MKNHGLDVVMYILTKAGKLDVKIMKCVCVSSLNIWTGATSVGMEEAE